MRKHHIFCSTCGQRVLIFIILFAKFFLTLFCHVSVLFPVSLLLSVSPHISVLCFVFFFSVWKPMCMACTCMVLSVTLLLFQYRTVSTCNTMLWWQQVLCACVCELKSDLWHNYHSFITGKPREHCLLQAAFPPHWLPPYLPLTRTRWHTVRRRQVSKEVSQWFSKSFTESSPPSLPD